MCLIIRMYICVCSLLVWGLPVACGVPSPAMQLLKLTFTTPISKTKRLSYVSIICLCKYIFSRVTILTRQRRWESMSPGSYQYTIVVLSKSITILWRFLSIANMILFIKLRDYRNIGERLLNINMKSSSSHLEGIITYDNLVRQLLWKQLTHLSLLLLSLVDMTSIQHTLTSTIHTCARLYKDLTSKLYIKMGNTVEGANTIEDISDDNVMPMSTCVLCKSEPACMAYVAIPCKHIYCYYCLYTVCKRYNRQGICQECGEVIKTSIRQSPNTTVV